MREWNRFLWTTEKESRNTEPKVDFYDRDKSSELKNVSRKLAYKQCCKKLTTALYTWDLHLLPVVIDCETGITEGEQTKTMHNMYSDLIRCLNDPLDDGESNCSSLINLGERIRQWNEGVKVTLNRRCKNGSYAFKFHLLHDLVQDLERFGNLGNLDAFLFERFNIQWDLQKPSTYRRRASGTMKTVEIMDETREGSMRMIYGRNSKRRS